MKVVLNKHNNFIWVMLNLHGNQGGVQSFTQGSKDEVEFTIQGNKDGVELTVRKALDINENGVVLSLYYSEGYVEPMTVRVMWNLYDSEGDVDYSGTYMTVRVM